MGTAFPRVFGMNGGYFRASKLRQAQWASELELPSFQSSNHLNHWIDHRSIYKTLKDRRHWSNHALSRATGVLWWVAHAPLPHSHSKTQSSGLWNSKTAPPLESSLAVLSFGGGRVAIREATCLHAPILPPESIAHAPTTAASFEAQIGGFLSSDSRKSHHHPIDMKYYWD